MLFQEQRVSLLRVGWLLRSGVKRLAVCLVAVFKLHNLARNLGSRVFFNQATNPAGKGLLNKGHPARSDLLGAQVFGHVPEALGVGLAGLRGLLSKLLGTVVFPSFVFRLHFELHCFKIIT